MKWNEDLLTLQSSPVNVVHVAVSGVSVKSQDSNFYRYKFMVLSLLFTPLWRVVGSLNAHTRLAGIRDISPPHVRIHSCLPNKCFTALFTGC